jgi:hypothetical protein
MTNSTLRAEGVLGNEITYVQRDDGTVYVSLKSLCRCLGIDHD